MMREHGLWLLTWVLAAASGLACNGWLEANGWEERLFLGIFLALLALTGLCAFANRVQRRRRERAQIARWRALVAEQRNGAA